MRGYRRICTILLILASCMVWGQSKVELGWRPVWRETQLQSNGTPLVFEITNEGPDDRGILTVDQGTSKVLYGVEMPAGSKRQITIYPKLSEYTTELNVTLRCNQGTFPVQIDPGWGYSGGESAAVISDNPGLLTFLRTMNADLNDFEEIVTGSCNVEDAPERSVGYSAHAALFLSDGTERLSDQAVSAIKRYALNGGVVVFVGGARTAHLNDPRWAGFIPVSNIEAKPGLAPQTLSEFGDLPTGTITHAVGTVDDSAVTVEESGVVVQASRTWGFGSVVFLSYSIFDGPMRRWDGRRDFVLDLVGTAHQTAVESASATDALDHITVPGGSGRDDFSSSFMGYYPDSEDSPFNIEPPSLARIMMILVLFLVAVVPVNFFVLNKIGRKELAWVTAPIISLAFSGVLFANAANLYSSGLSSRTVGVLVMQSGSSESVFSGTQQFFFPRPGRYNLELEGTETVWKISQRFDPWSQPNENTDAFYEGFVDNGEINAPAVPVGSLAFKEIGLSQSVDLGWSLPSSIRAELEDDELVIRGTLTNDSPYELTSCQISIGEYLPRFLDSAAPGETINIDVAYSRTILEEVSSRKVMFTATPVDVVVGSKLVAEQRESAVFLVCGLSDVVWETGR